jgi:glutaredoxin-like protein
MPESMRIKMYGTNWCGDCRRARQFFADNKIDFDWIDIDQDQDARRYVESVNNGNRSVPTILFPDGSIIVEPSHSQLITKMGLQ